MEHPQHYHLFTRIIHWLSALVIFGLFGLGFYMVDLGYYDPFYKTGPWIHKSVGILFTLVLIARLIQWQFIKKPEHMTTHQKWEIAAAKFAHIAMYVLLFAIVISGYLISTADGRAIEVFDWFEVPATITSIENQEDIAGFIHEWLAYFLIALALIHGAGALKHHFIDKDSTLMRMIKPGGKS